MYPELPVITFRRRWSILPTTCSVTGERIGWFATSYFRIVECEDAGCVITIVNPVSEQGRLVAALKGEL